MAPRLRVCSALSPLALVIFAAAFACKSDDSSAGSGEAAKKSARDAIIAIDGSSTVFPITEAVAEEFREVSSARVTIGVSGTGGGFKKFCNGESVMIGASRPIKKTEIEACAQNQIEYVELPVAYDGITVVVNQKNDWLEHMTVSELQTLWRPEAQGKVKNWSQVRTGWPEREIHLYGPGVDSGTYDYFTQVVVGKAHSSRGDYTSSEDDNVLVQGVAMDPLALGFFGFAYYKENASRLKVVPIAEGDAGKEQAVAPTLTTIADGSYRPLSRPIFVYFSKKATERPEVDEFAQFYLKNAGKLAQEVGYVPLENETYAKVANRYEKRVAGSVFSSVKGSANVDELLSAPAAGN